MNKLILFVCSCCITLLFTAETYGEFQAGAAVVNVTPNKLPAIINGGMTARLGKKVVTPVNARAIVLDDGKEKIAIVIVDSCMIPRILTDDAKALAATKIDIKPNRILISATHTHSAPASMSCLGTTCSPEYQTFLRIKIAEAIVQANKNLEPAQVGWGSINAHEFTALRRWINEPGKIGADPFGNKTMRAQMHAGANWKNVTGESGPEDPELSMISIKSINGRPIAVLANFSMHYFGDKPISADYFGLFSEGLKKRIASKSNGKHPDFVGIMSHGCSGDIWKADYTKPAKERNAVINNIKTFADGLLERAISAYQSIEYQVNPDLAMAESRLELNYRVPDNQRLEWAKKIVKETGDREPKTTQEVYAREQVILHERQSTEVVLQGIKIGDITIGSFPTETYALTGLKVKKQSPYQKTMVIELANGGDGYIPPPEQHYLGGYNTWEARSAGLEVQAEPKMTETVIQLLEKITNLPRRSAKLVDGPASHSILSLKPLAYWRMNEMEGFHAIDDSGYGHDGYYEQGVVYHLAGPETFNVNNQKNRAVHFAGGRMSSRLPQIKNQFTISLWFWNGIDFNVRETAGWMFSRGNNRGFGPRSLHLGLGGKENSGKILLLTGNDNKSTLVGKTAIKRWEWNHVVLVQDNHSVKIYLNGNETPEIETTLNNVDQHFINSFFLGGRSDNQSNWEGRLDEIAVFNRALNKSEIKNLNAN